MEDDPPVGLRPDQVAVKLEDDRPKGVIDTPTIGHNGGPPRRPCRRHRDPEAGI